MTKNGKQLNFILEQIQTNDSLETYSEIYHFKPAVEDLKKRVTLKVSGSTDIKDTLDKLGLPDNKGDLVTIEINVKQIQSKLIQSEEEPEEKIEDKKDLLDKS